MLEKLELWEQWLFVGLSGESEEAVLGYFRPLFVRQDLGECT